MDKQQWIQKLKKAFSRKSLAVFIDKFGFYLALLVCLAVVGFTALLTQQDAGHKDSIPLTPAEGTAEESSGGVPGSDDKDKIDIIVTDIIEGEHNPLKPVKPDSPSAGQDQKDNESTESNAGSKPERSGEQQTDQEGKDTKQDAGTKSNTGSEAVPASGKGSKSTYMELPVKGEIVRHYSVDELVYSQTLKEWTTHTGIDIAGTLGGEVRAALAGTVESIEEDSLKGIVITLAHEKGLKTVYMGLSTKDMVRVGQKIEKGQVISGIGRTAAFEITDDPHLHFEVLLNGKHQNPAEYIQGK
mgnify:CR=1 FL=1